MDDIQHQQFVTFALNGECYGVDILSVREIRAKTIPTRVPNSHEQVVGVINLRGAIIPIIDLRVAFGLRKIAVADGNAIVIATNGSVLTGLLVDEVLDIISVRPNDISNLPTHSGAEDGGLFDGLVTVGEQITAIINLKTLLSSHEPQLHLETTAA